jgi:hypothetical protein
MQLAPQDNQLMPKRRVLSFKLQRRLECEATTARTKPSSPIIPAAQPRVINSDQVFGTDSKLA